MDATKQLGQRIRKLRKAQGWTQKALAERAGISLRFLGQLETGQANVSVSRLADVAAALNVSFVTLFAGLSAHTDVPDRLATYAAELTPSAQKELWEQFTARTVVKASLVGLRGAGKSTIGKQAADVLGWGFVVVDDQVRARAGLDLADVFEMHGATGYHRLCREVLRELLGAPEPTILEVGGSVVADEVSWQLLAQQSVVIWLRASALAHLTRVAAQGDLRPMEGFDDALLRVQQILSEREPLYQRAHRVIDTEAEGIEGATQAVVKVAAPQPSP